MKKKLKRLSVSFVCLFLAISILFMTACSNRPIQPDVIATLPTETSCSTETTTLSDTTTAQPPVLPEEDLFEDYELNPTKDFVCRLIYSDLNRQYDTFTGYITLNTNTQSEDVNEIYGISYVDYQEGYIDDNGKTYFSSGFIRFPGEPILDNAIISQGLEIVSLEEPSDELFSYIYAYSTKDLHQHCVYNNQYIKYDIINGEIQYTEEPYTEGMSVDPTRGNIYNYDTEQYVYIVTKQDYIPVSGVSILGEADYQDILNEVNRILREQEANFSYAEIETYVSYSQEAFLSYLLGLQEETFIGISTSKLIQAAENIDPMQHLRIEVDESGCTNIQIINVSRLSGMEEKIIASLIGAFATVGGIVLNLIPSATIFKVFAGAVVGASMEVFSQVVLNNTPTTDIQWEQMAVAVVSGAISGAISISLGNYQTFSVLQNFMKESIDTLCDSIIGGGEYFTNALIAGQSFEEACQNFGYGVIAGAVISSAFKLGSLAIKPVTNAVKKAANSFRFTHLENKVLKKLSNKFAENGLSEISEKAALKVSLKNADVAIEGISHYFDDNGNLYRIGDKILPNIKYIINRYTYTTDALGRKINVKGDLYISNSERGNIKDSMEAIGKGYQWFGDQRGHLIGDRFGGSNGLENLIPQDANINLSDFKKLENQWAKALEDGKKVSVNINIIYEKQSFRPKGFVISSNIDGKSFESIIKNSAGVN